MNHSDDTERAILDDVEVDSESEYDGRTPLDKTIDKIGMGLCTPTSCRELTLISNRKLSMDTAVIVRVR